MTPTPLKPYPKMKDSGVEWLGEVPEHWDIKPTLGVFKPSCERNIGMKENTVLSLSYGQIIIKPPEKLHGLVPESFDTYQIVKPGDIILRTTDLQNDHNSLRVGKVANRGIITSAYLCLKTLSDDVLPDYGHCILNVWDITKGIYGYGSGLRQNLDFVHFRRMPLPLPPLPEQTAIVRYLDYMDRRIRLLIRAKRKLITLLNEQKQVIIHHAVTRGLDPNVPLKDSGVEWLGMVPEHWEVMRCGQIIQLTTGFPFKSDGFSQSEEDIRLLRGINISPGSIRWDEVVRWPSDERYLFESFELAFNDIVLGMDRPIISTGIRVAQICEKDIPCLLLQRVARIRPVKKLSTTFFLHILAGKSFMDYLSPIFTGISVPHLSPEQIKSFRLAVPPLVEQTAIVKYLDQATSTLDTTITRAQREIDLLTEYRTRLIADVVTGKVDVREVAAGLPEVDPLAGVEEAEDGLNGDDEDETGDVEGLAEEVEA